MRKTKKKIWIKIVAFILIFGLFFVSLYVSSSRILQDYAVKDYSATITGATYRAFDSVLSEGYDFSSIIRVDKNSQGEIVLLSTDSYGVNKIASDISKRTQKILNEETDKGVEIPIGAFTGIRLLAGFGKKIRMKLLSVSFVKTEIVSNFSQAGINQTRHTLMLNLRCETAVLTHTGNKTVKNEISMLIYDNLIVGKVPSVLISPMIVGQG